MRFRSVHFALILAILLGPAEVSARYFLLLNKDTLLQNSERVFYFSQFGVIANTFQANASLNAAGSGADYFQIDLATGAVLPVFNFPEVRIRGKNETLAEMLDPGVVINTAFADIQSNYRFEVHRPSTIGEVWYNASTLSVDYVPTHFSASGTSSGGGSGSGGTDPDIDDDGVNNDADNCPSVSNPLQENFDGDSFGDLCDPDDDNDGVVDGADAFPLDASETRDNDADGTGDNADLDDDNDGIPDEIDASPFDPDVSGSISVWLGADSDDAEERSNGTVILNSIDLEMTQRKSAQTVGLRFPGLTIPANSTIDNAYIQFYAEESQRETTELTLHGQAADDAQAFTWTKNNISGRKLTRSMVTWSVPHWVAESSGIAQRSPDIASIVQEIVSRLGWKTGNGIAIIVGGYGKRVAYSLDGNPDKAARLIVEFRPGIPQVEKPEILPRGGAFSDSALVQMRTGTTGAAIYYTFDSTEPEVGDMVYGGPFTLTGDTHLRAKAFLDGYKSSSTSEAFFEIPVTRGVFDRSIDSGNDDAEERVSGRVSLHSEDLELLGADHNSVVGLRYTGIPIPNGARITYAYLQFTAEAFGSGSAHLLIEGQAHGDAPPFTGKPNHLSNRYRTIAHVVWDVPPWFANDFGIEQQSADISVVIQELVNRFSWDSGNAIALIISGVGNRSARSFEAGAAQAPILHIEFIP